LDFAPTVSGRPKIGIIARIASDFSSDAKSLRVAKMPFMFILGLTFDRNLVKDSRCGVQLEHSFDENYLEAYDENWFDAVWNRAAGSFRRRPSERSSGVWHPADRHAGDPAEIAAY
jgi:hypothetical protein